MADAPVPSAADAEAATAPEAEDLESLERERIELIKRLEAEEDGEIPDDDDDDEELPEHEPGPQPKGKAETGAPTRPEEAAEPVSDGELDDSPESPAPDSKPKAPADKVPTKPVVENFRRGDYDWDEDYGGVESKSKPPAARGKVPAPLPHRKYEHRSQNSQITQFRGSGSNAYRGYDHETENWDEPPPTSRPKLTLTPTSTPTATKSHVLNRSSSYESRPTPTLLPQRRPQMQIGRSIMYKGLGDSNDDNWDEPESQVQAHPSHSSGSRPPGGPAPVKVQPQTQADDDDYDWGSRPIAAAPSPNRPRPGPLLPTPTSTPTPSTRFNPNLHQHQNTPPPSSTPAPALTGRALWAQRAKELETLNPIGDWVASKKKNKGKKGNQLLSPPPQGLQHTQHQKFQNHNQPPFSLAPAPAPENDSYQWKRPGNWQGETAPALIADENEDWDQPSIQSMQQTQNWEPDQAGPRPKLGLAPMYADGDENWEEPPLPQGRPPPTPVAADAPPEASAPPTPTTMSAVATPFQISVSVPEAPSAPVSYSTYAQAISSLLHWYGFSLAETQLLLSAPNLFRVRYEQLTVHLSANESALEQCFKVIGNDHDAYFKEGHEQKGLSDWRRVVSGDVWGSVAPTPTPRTGALPPPPPQVGNSLKAILKPSQQQAPVAEATRFYFSRPPAEPQHVQRELLSLETRTAQDQFNPANSTLPYQVFLEYGSFGNGISHEIIRFRYVEYVAQVNINSRDLLPSVVSAYGLGAGGWPTKVKEWLEMRFGAFKRVAQPPLPLAMPQTLHQEQMQNQNGPPPLPVPLIPMQALNIPPRAGIPMPSTSTPFHFKHQQQQQFHPHTHPQPSVSLPLRAPLPPSHTSHSHSAPVSPIPMPSPRQHQQQQQHVHQHRAGPRPQQPLPLSSGPNSPDATLPLTPIELPINYDHFQRLYARSKPALFSASALHSAYSEFCAQASARYSEFVHDLCQNWFHAVPALEVNQLVQGLDSSGGDAEAGGGQGFRNATPTQTPGPGKRVRVPPPAPELLVNGGAGAGMPKKKSREGNGTAGNSDATSSMSSSSDGGNRRRSRSSSTDKPILVTSTTAFRAAFKRRADIKHE